MPSSRTTVEKDIEQNHDDVSYLKNHTVHTFSWRDVSVLVKDRATGQRLPILSSSYGHVRAGEVLALMGPSGCGKTTLLNVLAHRRAATKSTVAGDVLVNGKKTTTQDIRQFSSYVEQEDALIGSLTVRETVDFAAQLSLSHKISKAERRRRVNNLLSSFGLQQQANTIVGTPIRKGISGGQKRRLGTASQLLTAPKILFLDEPTSGLDSAASYEVMSFIKEIAKANNIIVIASIHQPSSSTFVLFDQLMLLSGGKQCYFGRVVGLEQYFASISRPIPLHTNPAEYLLDIVNTDFAKEKATALHQVAGIQDAWTTSNEYNALKVAVDVTTPASDYTIDGHQISDSPGTSMRTPLILLHRNFIKSYRDLLAYGVRLAMYTGLAIMMGKSNRP